MLGLGKDIPLATGNESEALNALVDGKFMTFRIPYPMGYYGKGFDGRIDDANAGWKGRPSTRPSRRARRSTWKAARVRSPRSSSSR
jgi:hypothetical protein